MAIPRALYGAELRHRREAAGLSMSELSERLFCSSSLVCKFESGHRRPLLDMAEQIDLVLGTDGCFARMCKEMQAASGYADYFAEAAELEPDAETICEYAPIFLPGLLQTEAYTRAMVRAAQPTVTDAVVEDLVAARGHRIARFEAAGKPEMFSVVDESVIRRRIGGPAAMRDQLHHLLDLMRRRRVFLQVLPLTAGAYGMPSMTKLLYLKEGPPVVYIEGQHSGQLSDDPSLVARYARSYDLVRSAALSPEASLSLIESVAKEYAKHAAKP
ncbi:helix-turn-helix transcriptional regulator [Streptomyces sp. B1866]|uniref:helix-turn-helix domain-containing protein n=1 Tax=Streptomyces sp. B1866 TaxID=3075431 RepID=UPI00288C8E97|nr:helix-turn-helix transcriptional regulator [Streptomyces sp. B1866]MDT3398114.1 helix-turn-helix transcriptional regulator [Streptomyces sp. B1866]